MIKIMRAFLSMALLLVGSTFMGWANKVDRELSQEVMYKTFKSFIEKYPRGRSN